MTSPFRPANQPGQFNSTGQPHPTVPFGQPGAPAAVVLAPTAPLPTWNEQANGQFPVSQPAQAAPPQLYNREGQPVDQQGRPLNQAPPAPAGTFPSNGPIFQPQAQPDQQIPKNYLPDEYVFDGDNVPQELRGRTWRQVRGVYGALASDFISRPGAAPAPAPNMPAEQAPAPQAQAAPTTSADRSTDFWRDPLGAIERVVDSRLAPIQQRTAVQVAEEAKNLAASQIPDWASLEAEIIDIARAVPQDQMSNNLQRVGWWTNAADLARGRLMSRNQYQRPNQPQANAQPQFNQPPAGPRSVPATHEFFTEAPTAPNGNNFYSGGQANQWELTSEQKLYAQRMSMTEQEYRDWSGGVQRPQAARRW